MHQHQRHERHRIVHHRPPPCRRLVLPVSDHLPAASRVIHAPQCANGVSCRVHANGSRNSHAHDGQRTRAKPHSRSPHARYPLIVMSQCARHGPYCSSCQRRRPRHGWSHTRSMSRAGLGAARLARARRARRGKLVSARHPRRHGEQMPKSDRLPLRGAPGDGHFVHVLGRAEGSLLTRANVHNNIH